MQPDVIYTTGKMKSYIFAPEISEDENKARLEQVGNIIDTIFFDLETKESKIQSL